MYIFLSYSDQLGPSYLPTRVLPPLVFGNGPATDRTKRGAYVISSRGSKNETITDRNWTIRLRDRITVAGRVRYVWLLKNARDFGETGGA